MHRPTYAPVLCTGTEPPISRTTSLILQCYALRIVQMYTTTYSTCYTIDENKKKKKKNKQKNKKIDQKEEEEKGTQ